MPTITAPTGSYFFTFSYLYTQEEQVASTIWITESLIKIRIQCLELIFVVFKYKKVCTSCILLLLSLFYGPTGSVFFMLWPTKQIIKLVSPYVDSQPIWFEYCFFSRYHLKFACVMARIRNTSLGKKCSYSE